MGTALPYVASYGLIEKVLEKIKAAQTPERFTQDYLGTNFGMSGGSAMALIPLLKKIGFIGTDGVPTELYKKFRNENFSKVVMAEAIKLGFKDLYSRNEYAHKLPKDKLTEMVKEITGAASDSSMVKMIVGTFETLKKYAEFDSVQQPLIVQAVEDDDNPARTSKEEATKDRNENSGLGLNLSYTINLNLPASTDVAVFNAIFKSLKDNILQK